MNHSQFTDFNMPNINFIDKNKKLKMDYFIQNVENFKDSLYTLLKNLKNNKGI